ncbi:MAG: rhomboid family intramembrane serine protease [Paludibacteraceae bacterium]|nr:rhomboid family intramembrane serine protease [Paludibacteraceae bacterium]
MANILEEIKQSFSRGNYLTRLIYINAGVFVIVKLMSVISTYVLGVSNLWITYLELPAFVQTLLRQPWSIITYMFMHHDFIHLIFNLLTLYWFGKIFTDYFSQKQLVGLYFLGGIGGAIFYVLAYNFVPNLNLHIFFSYLIGASASVMAIIFALVRYIPDEEVNLALIGPVKLKYLGIAMLVLDVIGTTSINAGGSIAHIGGALIGFLFAHLILNSKKDITEPVNKVISWVNNLFKQNKKPKFTVHRNTSKTDEEWNVENHNRRRENNEEIDRILEKIKKTGYANLSDEEKKKLFDLSNKQISK